jgi:AraC family transcriptional regulator
MSVRYRLSRAERLAAIDQRRPVDRNSDGEQGGEITMVDVATGKPFPVARAGSVSLSSVGRGWRGIMVEFHRHEPQEMPAHYLNAHGIMICASRRPIIFGWKGNGRWHDRVMNPGEFHLITRGDISVPRWPQAFDAVTLALDPRSVADVVKGGLPAEQVEFVTQRAVFDATIARYIEAFRCELLTDSPNGLLYVDSLAIGFTLNLLSKYAVAKPRIPLPRGKLNPFQLRSVVDFIQSHLDEDLSLVALADQANVSPFHFARQFCATVGWTPHQFVLRQRIQKSLNLIKIGKLPLAQIAIESGFHDQPHFTRAFRKVVGTTPARYSVGR